MKHALRILVSLVCIAVILAGDAEARRRSRDHAVYISVQEIRELERSGVIIPAGKDAWMTRSGLVIAGRDPDGRTRLDHIMRHAMDNPRRPKHGVFSVTKAEVIGLMDEAWKKIRSGAVAGNERGGKIAYTVRMGRPVGYLGGRKGRERGNPKLDSVRLVITKGTTAVITFFPM
ncbi:MAG TPA: hypothetical protein PKN50_00235 [Spirochaetota bacterium]|jgi:hypothetical protein|nr:hypothetical protein [Spirochaetota bacterium]HPV39890.1 hypothetical protein [Spirochaetota bacterium]